MKRSRRGHKINTDPLRKVVEVRPPGKGSPYMLCAVVEVLECGHETTPRVDIHNRATRAERRRCFLCALDARSKELHEAALKASGRLP